MTVESSDILSIRRVLAELDPKSSSSAAKPLSVEELYTPPTHANALNAERPLVVGNRGVGKSVWSGALADQTIRSSIASSYPELKLDQLVVELGFHEDAGKVEGIAPSPKVLKSLLTKEIDAEQIWNAVLLRAVGISTGLKVPESLGETVDWAAANVERTEAALRTADQYFASRGLTFILVFDALDRLGSDWQQIRPLTEGILRLALGMQGFRSMRAKIFMRTDQAKDETLFQFPDASKMRAAKVELAWHSTDLYGLLFRYLQRNSQSSGAFSRIVVEALRRNSNNLDIHDPDDQKKVFSVMAGEFMGTDHRRGRTYTWVIDHLADAFHETTPRSFLVTLQRAAIARSVPSATVIDHHGIREGVQTASEIRVDQLQEDYPWIRTVLSDLAGLEVPCAPKTFVSRWKEQRTTRSIKRLSKDRPGPIELEKPRSDPEAALLEALKNIGVLEERSEDKINMPDIFRVAAKIKRRGGVRPPSTGSRRRG